MNRRCALGLCAIGLVTIPAFPSSSAAQGKSSLRDQLVGTWIYVSSTARRDDGSNVPRPSLQGAVTYTADGRFHFITTRTDLPKYASSDSARPSSDEAMAIASGSLAYTGTYTVDENTKTIHANIEASTFPNLVGAPNQRRIITSITDDEMKFTNPRTAASLRSTSCGSVPSDPSCRTPRYSPPVRMIKLTGQRELSPYVLVHPGEEW